MDFRSFLKKIKYLVTPSGTIKGELQLRQVKQGIIITFVLILIGFQVAFGLMLMRDAGWISSPLNKYDKNLPVLFIDKPITDEYVNVIMGQLNEIKKKPEIFPRLLIVVSSPGGSPQGSEELLRYLQIFQKTIPIIVYVQNMAASGSYYISVASKYNKNDPLSGIIANPNAIVGSIGVILPHMSFAGLAKKVGAEEDDLAVGEYKKPMSYFEPITNANRDYLKNNLMMPVYRHFLAAVAEGRNLPVSTIEKYADGKIFIATDVKPVLVDRISTIGVIMDEMKVGIEKRFPHDEVGFVQINTDKRNTSLINVSVDVSSIGLDAKQGQSLKSFLDTMY